jgi:hypothetical protein
VLSKVLRVCRRRELYCHEKFSLTYENDQGDYILCLRVRWRKRKDAVPVDRRKVQFQLIGCGIHDR